MKLKFGWTVAVFMFCIYLAVLGWFLAKNNKKILKMQ
jgi:hypothetical protein